MSAGEQEKTLQEKALEEKALRERLQGASEEPVYVISIAARLAGLPSWTLRVLDKEGIVRPRRTAKDRRLYSDRDLALLARIRYLSEERGVNMNGVRLILEMEGLSPPGDAEPSLG